ncbi:MAG: CRISPR-associated protein Cas4 [Gammaproteobacteria bacterium]|nr:CRISPR-associated protein Cas4 [Gammaproteobacteria bacterium]
MVPRDQADGSEDEFIPISALQHFVYCPRQCALIHTERQWAENAYTAEGRLLHQRVDEGGAIRRGDVTTSRSVAVRSIRLGLTGVVDVVESRNGQAPYPVEYKRGRPKTHRADEVQLCAQAICLEEMLEVAIPEGALYYGKNRRRRVVTFDMVLRHLTVEIVGRTHVLLGSRCTPPAVFDPRKCGSCSLQDICQPRQPKAARDVVGWLARAISE